MKPHDLLLIARKLAIGVVGSRQGRPRQTELRRAVSAAYYALFHTLARCNADSMVGKTKSHRSQPAWQQTYRALDHGRTRSRCARIDVLALFPNEIQDFAAAFIRMQHLRHLADYDPMEEFSRAMVRHWIDETEEVITRFQRAPLRDHRAFAVHVLLPLRR